MLPVCTVVIAILQVISENKEKQNEQKYEVYNVNKQAFVSNREDMLSTVTLSLYSPHLRHG